MVFTVPSGEILVPWEIGFEFKKKIAYLLLLPNWSDTIFAWE